ncbi:MAG: DUF559 domain-containing protein [Acidimicrobiia bacterium]|nr:DUF559 domain-containing protein [Acidimicrobiia bacterium]
MSSTRALLTTASTQLGLFTRAQALGAGFSASAVDRRLGEGHWEPVLPGVYRQAGGLTSRRQLLLAAVLWAGPDAVASHATAGHLWGLDGCRDDGPVELSASRTRGLSAEGLSVHRPVRLDPADVTVTEGIPVTTVARTLLDLGGVVSSYWLEAALEDALRRGLVTIAELVARVDDLGVRGRPGVAAVRRVIEERGDAAPLESALEVRVWRLLRLSGLPLPRRQYPVEAGGASYRLDFAWPHERVAVEADGYAVHGGREAFQSDRVRLTALAGAGWRVLHVTWEDCSRRPEPFLRDLRRALAGVAA